MKRYRCALLRAIGLYLLSLLGAVSLVCGDTAGVPQVLAEKSAAAWQAIDTDDIYPGYLLVQYKGPVRTDAVDQGQVLLAQTHQALGSTVTHQYRHIPWQVVQIPSGMSLLEAAAQYAQEPNVTFVEPNQKLRLLETIPDDPNYDELWGMERINAPQAWDVETDSSNIVVAVIDTGIRYTHEDLASNLWVNPSPGPMADIHGAAFTGGGGGMTSGDPNDNNGHGTHVSGTIGAMGNNGIGVAGVTWNVQIMGLKFLDPYGSTADAISALEYAIEKGAHLSNNSWGGGGSSQALIDMIAVAGVSNQLFVAAAGNDGQNADASPMYPAAYTNDNIISVASIAEGGALSGFSNYGAETVDLGAPGSAIHSAWNTADDAYNTISGTSMASPHVAGAVALLLGAAGGNMPYAELRDLIFDTATPNPALEGITVTGAELNLYEAIQQVGSSLALDRQAYRSDGTAGITLLSASIPISNQTAEVAWEISRDTAPVSAGNVTVTRIAPTAIEFTGTLPLTGTGATDGDLLTVSFLDAQGNLLTAAAMIDDVPPAITNARIENITESSFQVLWDTDEPASSEVSVDTVVPPVAFTFEQATYQTNHMVAATGLESLTLYYARITVEDYAGNTTYLPVPGQESVTQAYFDEGLVALTRAVEATYETQFERGPEGWTAETLFGETMWEYGEPRYGPDPGSRSWGTVIDGDYASSSAGVLTSPVLYAGKRPQLEVDYWASIGVLHDRLQVEARTETTPWQLVGTMTYGQTLGWETATLDLDPSFAGQAIQVRARFESDIHAYDADGISGNPPGFYLDAVRLTGLRDEGLELAGLQLSDSAEGDGDGYPEAGETVTIQPLVANFSDVAFTGLTGTVSVVASGSEAQTAFFPDGVPATLAFGDVEVLGLGAATAPIRLSLPATLHPTAQILLVFQLADADGTLVELTKDLSVEPRVSISGQVTDVDGVPQAGETVEAQRGAFDTQDASDVDGNYLLQGLYPDSRYRVSVGDQVRMLTVPAGGLTGVDFVVGALPAGDGTTSMEADTTVFIPATVEAPSADEDPNPPVVPFADQAVSGMVTVVTWSLDMTTSVTNPLAGAKVLVEDTTGATVATTTSDSNGVYQISAPEGPHWFFVEAPPAPTPPEPPEDGEEEIEEPPPHPWYVAPSGRTIVVAAGLPAQPFVFQDYGFQAPHLQAEAPIVVDADGDGAYERGELLTVQFPLRNETEATALSVTGHLATAWMGLPDVMDVTAGVADTGIDIYGGGPVRELSPPFTVQVDTNAPKGALQRFTVQVEGVNSRADTTLAWPFNFKLYATAQVQIRATVSFSDNPDAEQLAERLFDTRVRLTLGDEVMKLRPDADGDVVFRGGAVQLGTNGTIEVSMVPPGYDVPTPVAIGPLTDDLEVAFVVDPWAVEVDPAALQFAFAEGESTNGSFTVRNPTGSSQALAVRVRYRRTQDEVIKAAEEESMTVAAASEEDLVQTEATAEEMASYQTTDEVVVRFADGVSRAEQEQLLAEAGLEPVFYFKSSPSVLARPVPVPEGEVAAASAEADLADDKRIVAVTPDTVAESYALPEPNDPLYDLLYGLRNERQTGGTIGMDIRAPQAWQHTTGSKKVVVAVADTGIMTTHRDLADNIWYNPSPGTTEGIEGDIHGWNFYDWSPHVEDDSYFGGHGTHVAGTIGAVGDNVEGVVGVNWTVNLMGVRLVGLFSQFTTSARIAKAIEYAAENGAQVSNHSWGGPDTAGVMRDAILYAAEHNHLVIAAAGNSALDLDVMRTYPAGYGGVLDNVITVAASDHDGELAYFSNFGENRVQLAAPGYDILSTVTQIGIPGYTYMSGTSMAAPHVTGVAALLWSLDPEAPYQVIRDAILAGARPDPRLTGWVQTGGHLDAERALRALGAQWLEVDQSTITLAPGAEQVVQVAVNDPAVLQTRAVEYMADIQITQANGAASHLVPVTAAVSPGVWLDLAKIRIENQAAWGDNLAASPGDTVDIWVQLENRGAGVAQGLTGVLQGGAGSTIVSNTADWGFLYGGQTDEALAPFRVALDPAATNDITFTLEVYEKSELVGSFPVEVPVLPGHRIAGRVVADGVGVAAAVETVGAQGAQTQTSEDGSFFLRGLADGDYEVRILPTDFARTNRTVTVAGSNLDIGDITVLRPAGMPATNLLDSAGILGAQTNLTLAIHNDDGDSPFRFTARAVPKRRIALISDGDALATLIAPLQQMGFVVSHYTGNFERAHVFYPSANAYQIEQIVHWSDDAGLLSRYDAVIADVSGPDGVGRLFQSGEASAFSNFVQRGGTAILTGANPLSIPDDDELAELVGVNDLDRAATPSSGQVSAQVAFESPFLDLATAGSSLLGRAQAYDLASVATNLSLALFETELANKILTRPDGAGRLYLWTANGGAQDWVEPGVWLDLLRGMLWNALYEGHDTEIAWLQFAGATGTDLEALHTLAGEVPEGSVTGIVVQLDAGYPLRAEEQEAVVVILGQAGGSDVRAVDLNFAVAPPVLRVFTSGRVADWRGNPLQGDGGEDAARYQVLVTDPTGTIQPPSPDGRPGLGNRLLATEIGGRLYGRFGAGVDVAEGAGKFDQVFGLPEDQVAGYVFVRAWDGATFQDSIAYGDSSLFAVEYAPGAAQDFGSWGVTNALHPDRDSNNDSVADGWVIENALHLDPRDPVEALESRGEVEDLIAVPNGRVLSEPRRVAVAGELLFVLDPPNHRLLAMDRASGTVLHALGLAGGMPGAALGAFSWPYGLALDPRAGINRLLVADTGNSRLQVIAFDPTNGVMTAEAAIGTAGTGAGQLNSPRGVTVMPVSGDIFVADTGNNRVQVFRASGDFLFGFAGGTGYFMQEPHGIAVDSDHGVYVADTSNARILQYTFAGTGVRIIGPDTGDGQQLFSRPVDLQVWRQEVQAGPDAGDEVRRLVVTDEHLNRIQLLDMTGVPLLQIGSQGTQKGELRLPYGAFPVAHSNVLYVADRDNQRIQSYAVVLDADADGMEDLWEDRVGLDSSRDDAFEDADGDGLLNIGEYLVGADPRDDTDNPFAGMAIGTTGPFTILGFETVEPADGGIVPASSGKAIRIMWQARSGVRYRLEWTDTVGQPWETLGTYEARGSVGSLDVPAEQAKGFFRVVRDE